eukprot:177475-Pelagomonas_calceolata.AAC.3
MRDEYCCSAARSRWGQKELSKGLKHGYHTVLHAPSCTEPAFFLPTRPATFGTLSGLLDVQARCQASKMCTPDAKPDLHFQDCLCGGPRQVPNRTRPVLLRLTERLLPLNSILPQHSQGRTLAAPLVQRLCKAGHQICVDCCWMLSRK